MTAQNSLVHEISQRLKSFASERLAEASDWGQEAKRFVELAQSAFTGGKLLRSRFCVAGWRAAQSSRDGATPASLVDLCAALEVFQAAALAHDDVIDNSDVRRGKPSAHRQFAAWHGADRWRGDGDEFGRSSAILLGDLLLSWSDDLFESAIATSASAGPVRQQYAQMRREVMVGQFLDVAEEHAWPTVADSAHIERALRVASLKSARYSVQQPLLIGALFGEASTEHAEMLGAFGHDLGLAFQLRDDVLGVFGESATTGKPAGDDLREGKRTLLVAYTRERLTAEERTAFDAAIGDANIDGAGIASLQGLIESSGALTRVEADIERYAGAARASVMESDLREGVIAELLELVDVTTQRAS